MKTVLITGGCGYIGSRVRKHLVDAGYRVASVDLELFWKPDHQFNLPVNFRDVPEVSMDECEVIIHLAGHSSVPWVQKDPRGSLRNNCVDFFRLVEKLQPDQKFIYASSASVYGFSDEHRCSETDPLGTPLMDYDRQKQLIDLYMESSRKNFYGLRFGTVCGYSPVPRNELMINAMTRSAIKEKVIRVSSADSYRAVLGLDDLCEALRALIESDASSGFYNLASFNATIDGIAHMVSEWYSCVPIQVSTSTSTPYSFCLNTEKFCSETGFTFRETGYSIAHHAGQNDHTVERKWPTEI